MTNDIVMECCFTNQEIRTATAKIMGRFKHLLPRSRQASILIKPNLNSDMNALTGNTTDLRLLAAVLAFLHRQRYRNIVIADGTSSGFLNMGIDVISRLKVDRLAGYFGAEVLDLNYTDSQQVELTNGTKAAVASICLNADFIICLPKLKTHAEVGMSVALKNLVGCVVGVDKQKVHEAIFNNLLRLNDIIKPNLYLVDGIIGMEGLGPSKGVPIPVGVILAGTNPYLIDLVTTRLTGIDYRSVYYLKLAEERGLINDKLLERAHQFDLQKKKREFEKPNPSTLAAIINHPDLRRYFAKIRYLSWCKFLFTTDIVSRILIGLGVRQDVFISQDSHIDRIVLDQAKCNNCRLCFHYCPLQLNIPDLFTSPDPVRCLDCLYCYFICPREAINYEGEEGYLVYQCKHYRKLIRRINEEQKTIDNRP